MSTSLDTRVPPPVWMLGAALAQWALAGRPDYLRRPGRTRFLLAGSLGTISAAVGIAAVWEFFARGTTIHPGTPAHASVLVTDRVYRYTRNPMYLALTGALVTNAAWLGSLRAVLPIPVFTAVITAFQVIPEEQALQGLFGEQFIEYRRRVPRWLGRRH